MDKDGFIRRVKTDKGITHSYYDAKLSMLVDEALEALNSHKRTAISFTNASNLDLRALTTYVAWRLDDKPEIYEQWKIDIEAVREK